MRRFFNWFRLRGSPTAPAAPSAPNPYPLQMRISNESRASIAMRLNAKAAVVPYQFGVKPPELARNVVPAGKVAAVMAADSASAYDLASASYYGQGFPGYAYLAALAARVEYRRIASALATELTREWIEVSSTESKDGDATTERVKRITARLQELGVRDLIRTAAEHDAYFGRGHVGINLRGDEDDRDKALILSPATITKGSLQGFYNVEPMWTTPVSWNALDPSSPDFYKPPEWFMLGKAVHASRLLTIVSQPVPDMLKPAYNFGGISLSQLCEPYVDNWLRTRQSVSDLIANFSITGLKTDLSALMSDDPSGAGTMMNRAALFNQTRSNLGLMLLDNTSEDLVQVNTPLASLDKLQAQAQEHMCSASRVPAIILTGISPSGLNASSEGEIRAWYDWIAAQQEAHYRKPLETIIDVIQLSEFGDIDPSITFTFCPLWQADETQAAAVRLSDAQAASIYVNDIGALASEEVRKKLATDPESGYNGINADEVIVTPEPDDGTPPEA